MNKRILALFLSMAMLFTLIPSASFAAEALTLTAESVVTDLKPGAEITIPVKAAANPGYSCGTVDIKWDESELSLKSVKYSDIAPDNSSAETGKSGTYRASFGDFLTKENFKKTGTFFTLTFTVAETSIPGDYAIELDNASIYDSALEAVPTVLKSAKVTLKGKADPDALAIETGSAEAVIGSDDEIRVPVSAVNNPGFSAGKIDLLWNSSALTLKKVEFTALAPDNGSGDINSSGNYRISFGDMLDKKDVTAKDVLFTLVFKVNGTPSAGEYQIMAGGTEVYDAALEKVKASVRSGAVTLTEKSVTSTTSTTTTATSTTTRGTSTSSTTSTTSTTTRGTSTSSTTSTTSTTARTSQATRLSRLMRSSRIR